MSIDLFSLGKIFPSDFLKPDEQPRCEPVELKLIMEASGLVHLETIPPKETMWGKYWYRSGVNKSMANALKDIVDSVLNVFNFNDSIPTWLDVASNDGTLLSFVPPHIFKVGFDPAEDSYKKECEKYADYVIQDYFSAEKYKSTKEVSKLSKPKVITSIAMFYDLQEPEMFIKDIYEILDDDGLWVMQLSYSGLMLYQTAFDNIVHEHWGYYSLFTLKSMLNKNGFNVVDCQLNDVNGGSFRVYIMKDKADLDLFGTQPYRDVCKFRIEGILAHEHSTNINAGRSWLSFFEQIKELKETVVSFIKEKKKEGKNIWAYGASTKGNTLLQYFELDNSLIDGIAERNPDKWGLRTVGTNIPIYSESDMRNAAPDYLLILPWHFINEFQEREKEYLSNGGHFIVPCPKFLVI